MAFDDDSRWDDVIANLNLLSICRYSGRVYVDFVEGRVQRRSVSDLHRLAERVKATPLAQEVVHAAE